MEKKKIYLAIVCVVIVLGAVFIYSTNRNVVTDPKLAEVINVRLEKEEGTKITKSDMALFKSLTCEECGIVSLEGMQYATNIENIDMKNNQIADASQISKLANLKTLNLEGNQVDELICTDQYETCEV